MSVGNFLNRVMENNNTIPVVGQYANQLQYVDRKTFLVKGYNPKTKTLVLEYLNTKADTSKGPLEIGHQEWTHEPSGQYINLKFRYNNWRTESGSVYKFTFTEKPDYYYCWEF